MSKEDLITKATVKGRFVGGGLFEARGEDSLKYSACTVLDEGEEAKIEEIVENAIKNKWGNKKPKGLVIWGAREGDDEEFEASFEKMFINPKSGTKPQTLVKVDGVYQKTDKEEGIIYPGCYVAVSVNAYAYDGDKEKNIKPGVTLNLRAVMFMKDGERLGDSVDAEEEFEGFDSEIDDDDFLGD